jgi:hypothetical protein
MSCISQKQKINVIIPQNKKVMAKRKLQKFLGHTVHVIALGVNIDQSQPTRIGRKWEMANVKAISTSYQ